MANTANGAKPYMFVLLASYINIQAAPTQLALCAVMAAIEDATPLLSATMFCNWWGSSTRSYNSSSPVEYMTYRYLFDIRPR